MEKAIVVISFDGYKDLWDTFFECYEKFFPDCMLPIYLQTVRKLRKALKNCVKSDIINI